MKPTLLDRINTAVRWIVGSYFILLLIYLAKSGLIGWIRDIGGAV